MSGKVFVDTNILVYAAIKPLDDQGKWRIASDRLLNNSRSFVVSTQVLNEFTAVLLRKNIPDEEIKSRVDVIAADCAVSLVTLETINLAWGLRYRYKFSYWDSLIVASALESGCTTLDTEDLNHGMLVENTLHVVNPFR